MDPKKSFFAKQLGEAMSARGFEAKPGVLEREFNLRYWGKPMTLHGVRRWLRGETLPSGGKLLVLMEWLQLSPEQLGLNKLDSVLQSPEKNWIEEVGYADREVLEAFMALPVPQRRVVREVILTFARQYQVVKP